MTDGKHTGTLKCYCIERVKARHGETFISPKTGKPTSMIEADEMFSFISVNNPTVVVVKIETGIRAIDQSLRIVIFYTGELKIPLLKTR